MVFIQEPEIDFDIYSVDWTTWPPPRYPTDPNHNGSNLNEKEFNNKILIYSLFPASPGQKMFKPKTMRRNIDIFAF